MMKNKLLLAMIVVVTSACTTIHFDNGDVSGSSTTKEKWHHNVALGLYELSDPINLKNECGAGQWTSVKTELTFINGLASGVVNAFLPIWYPKTVEVSCK